MRIIVKKGMANAVIITFHTTKKFHSDYERIKFFRELHGWKQTVPGEDKRYIYRRRGLLDDVPHVKIADSVFMIAQEHMKRMETFFQEWHDKVHVDMMNVMVEQQKLRKKLADGEEEDNIEKSF